MGFSAEITCLGDQIRPGVYELHSRFERVTNFLDPLTGQLVSLVTPEIGAGPNHIVVDKDRLADERIDRLTVDRHHVCLDDLCFQVAAVPRFESRLDLSSPLDLAGFRDNLDVLSRLTAETAPEKSLAVLLDPSREREFATRFERELLARFKHAATLLERGDDRTALRTVRGLGWGLTPSGDDFAMGVVMARQMLGLPASSPKVEEGLSRVFLAQVVQGCFTEKWKRLAEALLRGTPAAVRAAGEAVLKIGSTSGADTATGLVIGGRCGIRNRQRMRKRRGTSAQDIDQEG